MRQITVYGYDGCVWCRASKIFLRALNLSFVWRDVKAEPAAQEELEARFPNFKTVPQIFVGDDHIGGYDALSGAFNDGRLS